MLFRIANRDDPDRTLRLGLCCLLRVFWQATSVRNFRTFTVVDRLLILESRETVHIHSLFISQLKHMLTLYSIGYF